MGVGAGEVGPGISSPSSSGKAGSVTQLAKTPAAGAAFGAAQQSFLTWTAPSDGQMHQVTIANTIVAGAAGTAGGSVRVLYTSGGQSLNVSVNSGGLSANQIATSSESIAVDPGTLVNLQQATGLVSGAATMYSSFIGA